MIIKLTELVFDQTPIHFDPFEIEIPDMEITWDGGIDYLEEQIELEALPIEVLNQIPGEYEKLNYDYADL